MATPLSHIIQFVIPFSDTKQTAKLSAYRDTEYEVLRAHQTRKYQVAVLFESTQKAGLYIPMLDGETSYHDEQKEHVVHHAAYATKRKADEAGIEMAKIYSKKYPGEDFTVFSYPATVKITFSYPIDYLRSIRGEYAMVVKQALELLEVPINTKVITNETQRDFYFTVILPGFLAKQESKILNVKHATNPENIEVKFHLNPEDVKVLANRHLTKEAVLKDIAGNPNSRIKPRV